MNTPQVLFLHGFGENHQVWEDFLPKFEWNITTNYPNYSSWSDCHTLEEYALKIASDFSLDVDYYIVGHSMGGYIALELAKLFPQQIKQIVMLNSTAFPDSEEKKHNRDKTAEFLKNMGVEKFIPLFVPNLFSTGFSNLHPNLLENLIKRYQSLSSKGLISATLAMKNRMDGRALLESTTIPFLFIHGKNDSLISMADIEECVALNPRLHKMVLFEHSGHQAAYEESQKCFETIAHFLNLNNV